MGPLIDMKVLTIAPRARCYSTGYYTIVRQPALHGRMFSSSAVVPVPPDFLFPATAMEVLAWAWCGVSVTACH